jgi:hypothetical protein
MTVADDDLRPEVVAALTGPRRLPEDLVDQVLDATPAERQAAAAALTDRTRQHLERAGVLRPSTSVLDLHHDQVQLLAATYGLVGPWWATPGYRQRALGDVLKVVPGDVAQTVSRLLRVAGFLPPDQDGEAGQER